MDCTVFIVLQYHLNDRATLSITGIQGIFLFSLEQFLLQPFLQPREILCVICGDLGGFVDLLRISLSFYTIRQ